MLYAIVNLFVEGKIQPPVSVCKDETGGYGFYFRYFLKKKVGYHGSEQAGEFRCFRQFENSRRPVRHLGPLSVFVGLRIHFAQEAPGEHQKDATIALTIAGPFVQGDTVVPRDEDAFSFSDVNFLRTVVEHHFAGVDIIHGILV